MDVRTEGQHMVGSEGLLKEAVSARERAPLIHRRLDHSWGDGDDAAAECLPSTCETLGSPLSINTMHI